MQLVPKFISFDKEKYVKHLPTVPTGYFLTFDKTDTSSITSQFATESKNVTILCGMSKCKQLLHWNHHHEVPLVESFESFSLFSTFFLFALDSV